MKKVIKIGLVILIVAVVLFLLFREGVLSCDTLKFISYKNETQDKNKEKQEGLDGESDEGEPDLKEQDINKRYESLPIINNIRDKNVYYDYSNEKFAWWFKRNDNHMPSGCDDVVNLTEYGAYYADYRVLTQNELGTPSDAFGKLDEKIIYLTFDCGYENGYTEHILDVLKQEDVPACFFVTKTYIRDNVPLVQRMKEEGHQVGNHTITHPSLPTKSYEEIIDEVCGTADYMKEVTGYDMDPYLRPPKGEYSARTLAITHDLGYKTIFWSMAYLDYDVNNQPGTDYVIKHFEKYHHSGAIILMHNVSESNSEALQTVIQNMKREGYRFASLNELP